MKGGKVKRAVLITAIIAATMTTPCYATTAHEQAMSYILADQDKPTKAGDKFYTAEADPNPILCETTAYHEGTHGSHGDKMREGYAAAAPDMYGDAVMLYEAIPQEDGSFRLGEYLTTLEVRDTGYGYINKNSTSPSAIRADKPKSGTIEDGIHIDVFKENYFGCKKWMELTGGKVFAVIIEGKG